MGDVIGDRAKFRRGWTGGLPETPCGYGSRLDQTVRQRDWIPQLIDRYEIRTIADIGAGDLNWIHHMDLRGAHYQAYDLVPRAPTVEPFDLVKQIPPAVDLILCLWVLNHLPFEHSRRAIANLRASAARYLLMTDRPIWRQEQPPEIEMPYVERLVLRQDKGDALLLIDLAAA